MILNYPSGFYRTILPPAPENRRNVTYTISNEPPPRGTLFFLKISNAISVTSPILISSEPQGDISYGTLRSFRSNSVVSQQPYPVGAVLEFNEPYKNLDVRQDSLDVNTEFPRFNNPSTDPVNLKLLQAYESYQDMLLQVSQDSLTKQAEIENLERNINATISSLEATNEALKILENDTQLLDVQQDLQNQIQVSQNAIDTLSVEIVALNKQREVISDSIRRLVKVIS